MPQVSEDRIVYVVGLHPSHVAAIAVLGTARVVAQPTGAVQPPGDGEVMLAVCSGTPEILRTTREALPNVPVLALLSHPSEAPGAVGAGADYVLPLKASPPLVVGVYLAACRETRMRSRMRAYEVALEGVSDAVEIADPDGHYEYCNRAFERMTGYGRKDVEGRAVSTLRSVAHDDAFYEQIWSSLRDHRHWSGGLIGRRRDGSLVAQYATIKPVIDDGKTIRHVAAVRAFVPHADDVETDDHVNARLTALRNSERRYRTMLDVATDAIIVSDWESARIIEANAAAIAMFGYSFDELQQLTHRALAGERAGDTVSRMEAMLRTQGHAIEHRHPMQRKNGDAFWATVTLASYEFMGRKNTLAIIRDITAEVERQQTLEQTHEQLAETQGHLVHSARLAAIGQMAAGVAHEINNPLQYVLAGIDEIEALRPGDAELREVLADMRGGAERIRTVTRSLQPFARADNTQVEDVDLNEVVDWATRLAEADLRGCADLELKLVPVPTIRGQRARIGQLVSNLLTNAKEALPSDSSTKHRITIRTAHEARRVRLVVSDTGVGIPEDIRGRIFDPFFTTKPRNVGTGLGLAHCAEIVTRHGGSIEVESTVGQGSSFIVSFPQSIAPPNLTKARPTIPVQGTERKPRVLIVDDEELIIRTYKRFLKHLDVTAAIGGREALAILEADHDFDAILCDLMMPSIDGVTIYGYLEEKVPALAERVIFCSGGAFTQRVRDFLERIPNVLLDKPVTATQLRATLEAAVKKSS